MDTPVKRGDLGLIAYARCFPPEETFCYGSTAKRLECDDYGLIGFRRLPGIGFQPVRMVENERFIR